MNDDAVITPDAYCVIDHKGDIIYTVTVSKEHCPDQEADWAYSRCHEFINDEAGEGVDGSGSWVVRPLTIGENKKS